MADEPEKEPGADKPPAKPEEQPPKPRRDTRPLAFGSKIRRVTRINIPGVGGW